METQTAKERKIFQENVRWNFSLAMHGYGRDIRLALRDAIIRFESDCYDFAECDFLAIENHEVVSIDENDVDEPTIDFKSHEFVCAKGPEK